MSKTFCPVVELRNYGIVPGKRDTFLDLFDREFVESQENFGEVVIGQFRVVGDEDRVIWMRGWPDMEARKLALTAFYDGPVWKRFRDECNATLADDCDNVLLLRPASPSLGLDLMGRARPGHGITAPGRQLTVTTYHLREPAENGFTAYFDRNIADHQLLGAFTTNAVPNNYPRLKIRQGEHVLVAITTGDNLAAVPPEFLAPDGMRRVLLTPSARSLLR